MSAMYFLDFFFFLSTVSQRMFLVHSTCGPSFRLFLFFFISFYDTQCLSLYILRISFGFNALVDLY